jgi:hypothetical protein
MTKFASLQNQNVYKLVINNLQFDKLQVHVSKFTSLQVCKITKSPHYQLQNIKLQSYKLQNCNFINCITRKKIEVFNYGFDYVSTTF